jgi:hypothetical protein
MARLCEKISALDNFDLLLEAMQPYIDILETTERTKIGFLGRKNRDGTIEYGDFGRCKPLPHEDWVIWRDNIDKDFILGYTEEYKKYNFARIRLIKMIPKIKHYTWHTDPSLRLHIPLITNPNALMYFRKHKEILSFNLTAGNLWLTDTTKEHTAINHGDTNRYHIVYEFFT